MRARRYHPLSDPNSLGPLSPEEYEDFRSLLKHVRIALALLVLFSLVMGTLQMLKIEIWPALILGPGFAIGIYLLFRLLALKCPRCGTAPMASAVSVTTAQVKYSRFVALNPKHCRRCGARFDVRPERGA